MPKEASMPEAEVMELDLVNQSSASCHDTIGLSVELKLDNQKSPEQKILESKDNITTSLGNHIVDQHAEDSSNKLFELISGSNSTDHNQLLEIKENPDMSGNEFVVNGSNDTLNGLKVLPEDLKQEFEDDSSMSEIKYVNIQDHLEIGETVITSSGETLPKKENSTVKQMKPNPVKPCSETIEVVPCTGLKCVQQLKKRGNLRKLNRFEKVELITAPRPTPDMEITQYCKNKNRTFQRSVYKTSWLTGCSHLNQFFCWFCMFFSDDRNCWTRGYNDLNNLSNSIKKHQNSQKHLRAAISFHTFVGQRTSVSISRKTSEETTRYNIKVDHNRSVFKRLVDVVCHLAQMELPFRSQDESETSLNKGNFLELVILLSKYDQVLAKQLQENGTTYLTHKMQSDIIRSVTDVAKARIEAEIKQSQFVSVIVDETRVANERDQLFIVFRYSFENNIYERFMEFIDGPDCTVDELSQVVLGIIKKHECEKKVIAQSYDGTSLSATIRNGVQLQVKEVSPQAIYVWCDPHSLNMVLSKSCSRIDDVSSFFLSLFDLANFFSNNKKRLLHYDLFCSKRLPAISPANRWSYLSCIVNTAYEQKRNLRNLFTKITNGPQKWDRETYFSVDNLLSFVTSVQFNFYLEVFQAIFNKNDCLNDVKQISQIDLLYLTHQIDELKKWLNTFKSQFHVLYQNALQGLPSSRIFPCASARYNLNFVQIIENITAEINDRYQDTSHLQFLRLLNENHFERHGLKFPKNEFDTLKMLYDDHFDTDALRNQLMCIYSAKEMKSFNLSELIDFIGKNTLNDVFSELLKLTDLVATIPATCLAERELSNLNKRVHAYLSNAQGQDSPTDLATIAIEKELLQNLRYSKTFYDDVMKSFSSKDRSFELEYK